MILCVVFCLLGLLCAIIMSIVSNTLVLSEYSKGLPSQLEIQHILDDIIFVVFIFSAVFAIAAAVMYFVARNQKNKKNPKSYKVIAILLFIVTLISSVFAGIKSYGEIEKYECSKNLFYDIVEEAPNEEIPTQDERLFPFLEAIEEMCGEDAYYSLTKIKIPDTLYIHAQNLPAFLPVESIYDLEYISSGKSNILSQFEQQKNDPRIQVNDEKTIILTGDVQEENGITYVVYEHENYYEMRVFDNNSCFSVVFSQLDDFNNKIKYDYNELALSLYDYLEDNYGKTD